MQYIPSSVDRLQLRQNVGVWKDVVYGMRALRRNPAFTLAAVLSLALGIGANTAIFSLLYQVVLRSLPVADPERLVVLHGGYSAPGNSSSSWSTNSESVFPYPFYKELSDRDTTFAGIVACAITPVRVTWKSATQAADAELVSGNFFSTLGVPTILGRSLMPSDDVAPGAGPVAVLSYGFWSSRFGADASVVNRTVAINGQPFVVVGVATPKFNSIVQGDSPGLFVPVTMQHTIAPSMSPLEDGTFSWLSLFARLKPGVSMAKAQASTAVLFHAIGESALDRSSLAQDARSRQNLAERRLELRPAAQGITELRESWEKPLRILMIMVGIVLLIACANVAGLLVARATGRQREIAIRLALGANRWTLVKQLVLEGGLLALAGAVAGLALEHWSTAALLRVVPRDAAGTWVTSSIDWRVLVFTLLLSVVSALLFALVPALQATRPNLAGTLKDQALNVVSKGRFRQVLVTAQVALSLVLAVGAGLFSASAANLINANRGFRSEKLAIFSVDATLIRSGIAPVTAFYRDLLERLSALPGHAGVVASDGGPYAGAGWGAAVRLEGYGGPKGYAPSTMEAVSAGYFRTLGIPLRAGREFDERDSEGAPKAVVVNEAFVKKYVANQRALGLHLSFLGPGAPVLDREIVGVVADVRTNVQRPVREVIYYPYTQRDKPVRLAFYVRTSGDDARLAADIRRVVREADAGLPAPEIKPVELKIREGLYTKRLVAGLSMAFGILAALLAAIGLYGVISFAVARRTNEIGVRMALGALRGDVVRMVMLDAGVMFGIGIAVGLAGAFELSKTVQSQLFGVAAADFVVYGVAAGILAIVAAAAAFIPAWRASRIDPVRALRYE